MDSDKFMIYLYYASLIFNLSKVLEILMKDIILILKLLNDFIFLNLIFLIFYFTFYNN